MMKLDQNLRRNTFNWLLKEFGGTHDYKQYTWAAEQTLPRENQFCSPDNEKNYFRFDIKYCRKYFFKKHFSNSVQKKESKDAFVTMVTVSLRRAKDEVACICPAYIWPINKQKT